jgi:hypothetical protein
MKFEPIFFQVLGQFLETVDQRRMLASDGAKCPHFPTGGVRSKKFELISPKICRAGGIPHNPPFRPPAEATLLDLPACLSAGRPACRLDDLKFFFGGKFF